jgi:hypothetical protein
MYKFDLISLLVAREVDFLVVQSHMARQTFDEEGRNVNYGLPQDLC